MKITTVTARGYKGTFKNVSLHTEVDSRRGHLLALVLVDEAGVKQQARLQALDLKTVWKGGAKDTQEARLAYRDCISDNTIARVELDAKQFEALGLQLLRASVWSKRS